MMIQYTRRLLAPLAFAAALCSACGKTNDASLAQDSALSRDLARVGTDTAAQPALQDIPDTAKKAAPIAEAPEPKAPVTRPRPRANPPAPKSTAPAPTPTPSNVTPSGNTVATAPAGSGKALGSIDAGSTLVLNSTEKICTNTQKVGDRFVATVATAVTGSNGAVVPAGSQVVLEITQLKRSENSNDKIEMGFRVVSLAIGSTSYHPDADIVSAEIDRVRASSKGNDAKKVAGGAVAGAVLGQILGKNRKGTIIGAAAGAAAGGAAAAATANYEGCVNSGGNITIKLNSAMTVAAT